MTSAVRTTEPPAQLDASPAPAGPHQIAHATRAAFGRRRHGTALSLILLLVLAPLAWPLLLAVQPASWSPGGVSAEGMATAEALLVVAGFIAYRVHASVALRTRLGHVHATSKVLAQDLRTPLATAALLSQALRNHADLCGHESDQMRHLASRLDDTVRGINQILDIQVANAAITEVWSRYRQELRAGDLVARALQSYAFRGDRERGVVIVTVRRDFTICGSPDALEQCIHNLIKNSLKAVQAKDAAPRQGDIQIEVGTFQGRGRIVVTDRGCGIEDAIQGRVVDPFFTTTPGDTHGLGLAFAKAAVHHAGGALDIESIAGKGTTAIIDLPIAA